PPVQPRPRRHELPAGRRGGTPHLLPDRGVLSAPDWWRRTDGVLPVAWARRAGNFDTGDHAAALSTGAPGRDDRPRARTADPSRRADEGNRLACFARRVELPVAARLHPVVRVWPLRCRDRLRPEGHST